MKALALDRTPAPARPAQAPSPPVALLAQRHSTLGGGSIVAPPIVGPGRPLEPETRSEMERGFGQDFGAIRVHDDASAHDNARSLGALAYATGNDIVFGQGQYVPETPAGRALIAHELAHSVQQSGVQMKADGSIPVGSDQRLEAEADRAALAVTSGRPVTGLTRIGAPAAYRTETQPVVGTDPSGIADTKAVAPGAVPGLPPDVELIEENPGGTGATVLVVSVPLLTLPRVKGAGEWVKQAYATMASGKRLIFSPIFDGKTYDTATSIKAFMEKPGEKYKDIWLQHHGFTSLQGMAKAFRDTALTNQTVKDTIAKPEVKKIIDGFTAGKLTTAGCDIDHIVEKQIGGTSVPTNLQLLVSDKNQESGRQTYAAMVAEVKRILEPNRLGVKQLQIRFKDAKTLDDEPDGSFEVETLLRTGAVTGSADVKKKSEGAPVALVAGGPPEIVSVKASGSTPIEASEKRLIPGMRLLNYVRGPGSSATKGTDKIEAELASKPMIPGDKTISLTASIAPAPDPAAATATPGTTPSAAAAETRKLTLDPTKNKDIPFYYPYLSKGKLTKVAVDSEGKLSGEGTISPSIKFLGDLKVKFAPDSLTLEAPLDVKSFKSIAGMIHFTGGTLGLELAPSLKPDGNLIFAIGPQQKPLLTGEIKASYSSGVFIATGNLLPAKIPGIKDLTGTATYRSDTGWSGSATATSSTLMGSTADAKLSFWQDPDGKLRTKVVGGVTTSIRDKAQLRLEAAWNGGQDLSYSGKATVDKPLPGVDSVVLDGSYGGGILRATGKAIIGWKKFKPELAITYTRKDGDDQGRFTGSAKIDATIGKARGIISVTFGEQGLTSLEGSLEYQLTENIRPVLGVKLDEKGKLKLTGLVTIPDIELTKKWPAAGGEFTLLKGGMKFFVAPPIPIADIFCKISGSLRVVYGVGPVMLTGVRFDGSLYPFEENPQVEAHLKGRLSLPAYAGLKGILSVSIGAELLMGAAGAEGSLTLGASLTLNANAGLDVDAGYSDGGFSFSAVASVKGELIARLSVDLEAELYTLWGHGPGTKWTYPVASIERQLGPTLDVTLGRIGYSKGQVTLPELSQIDVKPKEIDPLPMLKRLLSKEESKAVTR